MTTASPRHRTGSEGPGTEIASIDTSTMASNGPRVGKKLFCSIA